MEQGSLVSHVVIFCFPQPNTWDRLLKTVWPQKVAQSAATTFRAAFLDEVRDPHHSERLDWTLSKNCAPSF